MTVTQSLGIHLSAEFAEALPELSRSWRPSALPDGRIAAVDPQVAGEVGLSADELHTASGIEFLAGLQLPEAAQPVATAYAGHQFGRYSPLLGDGRAVLLGELQGPDGRLRELHLKGSGPTEFSRGGDGFAALGPMLREHVISFAMHELGVPTTRSLAVLSTGRPIVRDEWLPGALLARVASSHLRVGTFQYVRSLNDVSLLQRLTDFAIKRHAPAAGSAERPALALLDHVVAVQAKLIAQWMQLGFVHGVMNTDNMTISGETIDYGPCAFMEGYDVATVFSSIDTQGRYRYGNQPGIAQWNLARLAEALLPVIDADEGRAAQLATASIDRFPSLYREAQVRRMRERLGLAGAQVTDDTVAHTADGLEALMAESRADLTGTMRSLGDAARGDAVEFHRQVGASANWEAWLDEWQALEPDGAAADRANPLYVPRNHLVEEALEAATAGDPRPFDRLMSVLAKPYERRPGLETFERPGNDANFSDYTTFCGT